MLKLVVIVLDGAKEWMSMPKSSYGFGVSIVVLYQKSIRFFCLWFFFFFFVFTAVVFFMLLRWSVLSRINSVCNLDDRGV